MLPILFAIGILPLATYAYDCVPRSYGTNLIVCVCNTTYCDGFPEDQPESPELGSAYWYTSDPPGQRFNLTILEFVKNGSTNPDDVLVYVDPSIEYQKILGFGGAFTDSFGVNLHSLSEAARTQLLRTYFDSRTGAGFSIGRVPIGGTDFSPNAYTLDDYENDITLEHFSLQEEDYKYKIPFLQQAKELALNLKLIATSWTAPIWMKTKEQYGGNFSFLKECYYALYTEYLIKFLDAYKKEANLTMFGMTTLNEPMNDIVVPDIPVSNMGMMPDMMSKWIANFLGPRLERSEHKDLKILALDDQRIYLQWFLPALFENNKTKNYVAGVATHWYLDNVVSTWILDNAHNLYPDKLLLMTEGCEGVQVEQSVIMGSWPRGETFFRSIIQYMNHWYAGWLSWNLALDMTGGPTWIRNRVDSTIIVDAANDQFYKQPGYYAMAHFSRFVPEDSYRVYVNSSNSAIEVTAFLTPSEEVVVVLYNVDNAPHTVILKDDERGNLILPLTPKSMNTVKYKS